MVQGTRARIRELAKRLRGVSIRTEPHYTLTYTYDATGIRGECGGVAFPACLDDLRRIVYEAAQFGVPLFVRGAGTGFSGGSIPLAGGLAVSTERLSRILGFDAEREEVAVECGVINQELQDYLAIRGYFYPPDPASMKFSTIGGNIAENAGGPRARRYGVTRRYVRSLTWVTADAGIVVAPLRGASALLIGAEGTLGVLYAAALSVIRLPETRRAALIATRGGREAMETAAGLLACGLCPSVLEFIDAKTMACVTEYTGTSGIDAGCSYLFVEVDGTCDEVSVQVQLLRDYCARGGISLAAAVTEAERELLWELRRAISPSLARRGVTKVNEDVSLPLGSLAEAVTSIGALANELALDCYIFGHCGDGNMHVNIMTDRRRKDEMERVELFVERIFEKVCALGGTLSGEHGVGITKKDYLRMIFTPEEIALQRAVKDAMDARGLLNPGKYFSFGA